MQQFFPLYNVLFHIWPYQVNRYLMLHAVDSNVQMFMMSLAL